MMRSSSATSRCSSSDAADEVAVAVGPDREVRAVHRVVALRAGTGRAPRGSRAGRAGSTARSAACAGADRSRSSRRRGRRTRSARTSVGSRVVLDGLHPRLARDVPFEMLGDQLVLGGVERCVERRCRRRCPPLRQSQRTERARGEVAVEPAQPGRGRAPRVAARSRDRRRCSSRPRARVSSSSARDRDGVVDRVATFDEEAGVAVVDQRAQPADRRRHHGRAARGGFERDQAEGLGAGRDEAHVGGPVEVGEVGVGLRRDEPHPVRRRRARRRARGCCASSASPSAPLGPPTTTQRDVGIVELGEDAHREVGSPLSGWMRPTNRSTRPPSRPRRSRALGAVARARTSRGRRRAGRSRCVRDRRRTASTSCVALVRRSRRASGRRTRSRRARRAARSSGIVVDTGVGLDARERVERRDEREVELVLQPVRDRAREPVVRVQHVDWWRRRAAASRDASTNGSTRSISSCFGNRRDRAGLDVHAPGSRARRLDDLGAGPGARRGCRRRTRHRPGRARTRALRRTRSCRRRRPHPAGRAATCAC